MYRPNVDIKSYSDKDLKKLMKIEHTYPDTTDDNFQGKVYTKREFYFHKIPGRHKLQKYKDIKKYRDVICGSTDFKLQPHQSFLGNFINPNTPYKGLLMFHGTGTGKCTLPDTLFYINGNIKKIEDIWTKHNTGVDHIESDGGDWSIPREELLVNTYNESSGKIIKSPVKYLYREKVNTQIKEIIFENGHKISITQPHKLLTTTGWTNDFNIGDHVCVPKLVYNCCNKNNLDVTEDLAYLLTWQISEGHERNDHYCVLIYNNNLDVLYRLKKCVENVGTTYDINVNTPKIQFPKNRVPYLQLYSKDYVEFLKKYGYVWGQLSASKQFPHFIMNSPKNIIKLFLKNYFDAEAYISERDGDIELSSASKIIIHQLFYLLKLFGIDSRIKEKMKCAPNGKNIKRKYYLLYISNNNLRLYKQHIGFNFKYKADKLDNACKRKVNPNIGLIPCKKILFELWEKTHLPYRRLAHHSYIHMSKLPSRTQINKIIDNINNIINSTDLQKQYNITDKKLKCLTEGKNQLQCEIDKDICYTKIKQVNIVNYSGYVYDLEIDIYHNYVANGIITHNTCAAITIAEKFKPMIQKYGTKIYVLVTGPLIRENWKEELLICTGETYLKEQDATTFINEIEKKRAEKNAINNALQYYKFMSYRSFYRKVLGERVANKIKTKDDKFKTIYKKNKDTGEFERDLAIDRIYNLNNTLIIADEAHNLTGMDGRLNEYGKALKKIIKKSVNLKVLLLTATPMKNLAYDVVGLINFLRPFNKPLKKDKIFNSPPKVHLIKFKPNGLQYFKNMTAGYVSYLRGADPFTFAKRIDMGIVPNGLLFTKIIGCKMKSFQRNIYDTIGIDIKDTLDRKSEAVANFAFPALTQNKTAITGYYGNNGVNVVKNQLKSHYDVLNKKIAKDILKITDDEEIKNLLYISDAGILTGKILHLKYLKNFSTKFYQALKNLNQLVWGEKGTRTAFVYSNLVKVGIDLFGEILIQNGYLGYDENPSNYKLHGDTRCYFCGQTYKEHQQQKLKEITKLSRDTSASKKGPTPFHEFHPATFISITGKTSDDFSDIIPEDKYNYLKNVFSNIKNKDGKYIKFVLGSKVMSEAISIKNVAEVHILDVHFNLGKVDQVVGRAIRHCSHYNLMNANNIYPEVKVYKYAVTVEKGLSSEEEMYKRAELKYLLINDVEQALKEIAIDCPLNRHGNVFPEELKKYKHCITPTKITGKNQIMCPAICNFRKCDYQCDDKILNKLYWDKENKVYKSISKENLDYSTFTHALAESEIETVKSKIKEMYKLGYVYTLPQILDYVKSAYSEEKMKLFDDFFCFKALDDLIPITENDFNNYTDTIFDKFNTSGYLIYVGKYYIFQPFNQNEDVPMYYRMAYDKFNQNQFTLYNYLKHTKKFKRIEGKKIIEDLKDEKVGYNFDTTMEYYDGRAEYSIVGIIDKESSKRKYGEKLYDVFKIRSRRSKILDKKRGTGIPSFKGAVCNTSKSKGYLSKICKEFGVDPQKNDSKTSLCAKIKEHLLFLEKYSTDAAKNKFTYIMIPADHTIYPFPYNLEDRTVYIKDKIHDKIKFNIKISIVKNKIKVNNKNVFNYTIKIKDARDLHDFKSFFESFGAKKKSGYWIIDIK